MSIIELGLWILALVRLATFGAALFVLSSLAFLLIKRTHLEIRSRGVVVTGAVVTCVGCLYFFLLYWNHFLGLRSGNGAFGGGMSYLVGLRPYRDYYCAVTPLDILKWAAVLKMFGAKLIVVRMFALFDRMLLSLLLYFWLVRFFRARDAALATLVTIVVSAGDISDPLASYNHDTILLAMLAGFLASFAMDGERSEKWTGSFALLSGLAACLSFGTKQTIGLGITVAIPVVVGASLLRLDGLRRALIFVGGFVLGWAACATVIAAWLMHAGLWPQFLYQVFQQGPAAKASHLSDFLKRALLLSEHLHREIFVAIAALAIAAKPIIASLHSREKRLNSLAQIKPLIAVPVIAFFAVRTLVSVPGIQVLRFATILIAVFASVAIGVYCFVRWILARLTRFQSQMLLLAAVSFSVAFMLSLSWPFFEAMLVPGLALFVATTLDTLTAPFRKIVYLVIGLLLMAQVQSKLAAPFGFAGWQEAPVSSARVQSELPVLEGFTLPKETVNFVDGAVQVIQKSTTSSDTIFTYPEFGIFYGLTGHRSPTLSWSHNIDVITSQLARDEADRLLRGRPAVLIYGPESTLALQTDEQLWREGHQSGQRVLIDAVNILAKDYCMEREFQLSDGHTVKVYVRPDLETTHCTKP